MRDTRKREIKQKRLCVAKMSADERWGRYFEGLLSVEKDREAEIVAVGKENGVKVLGGLNNSQMK